MGVCRTIAWCQGRRHTRERDGKEGREMRRRRRGVWGGRFGRVARTPKLICHSVRQSTYSQTHTQPVLAQMSVYRHTDTDAHARIRNPWFSYKPMLDVPHSLISFHQQQSPHNFFSPISSLAQVHAILSYCGLVPWQQLLPVCLFLLPGSKGKVGDGVFSSLMTIKWPSRGQQAHL